MSLMCSADSAWLKPHPKLEGVSLMDHLFSRMNGAYPNKWRSSFRDEHAVEDWKVSWSEAFDDEGITPNDVATGIKNCRRMYDWPPSLTEFLKACRPSLDAERAFHEAVKGLAARRRGEMGAWSHPAIFHAAVDVGQHDMLNGAYSTMKVRWNQALSEQLEKTEWAVIPEAHAQLPAPKRTEQTDKQAVAAMEKMGAADVLNKNERDHKAWAKRIAQNPGGRSPAIVAMARRAMEAA